MTDQLIASRYRVVRELGRGGMGVVYLVEHMRTGDQVALKLLYGQSAKNAQAIERFKREARASARIKSEHIVKVIDADIAPELDGAPFLVMELLNGTDLQKQLETKGRLAPDQALHYLGQAARALDKSHQMGIVHRDLKPENLFIHHREDGTTVLKILDFGISKIISGDGSNDMAGAGMTSTGAVMGTPLYMSPEQARGRVAEIGPATDVWAMGLICLQLLSGEVYWRANTVAELMSQILSEPLYAPSERWPWMPPAVDQWFARACARDPKQRFQSVGQQVDALGVALGVRSAASALPESSAPWTPIAAEAPAVRGATPLPGVNTTTSAVAREPSPDAGTRRSRAPLIVGAAVLVLGGLGAAAWVVVPRLTKTNASLAASATTSAAAATTPPSATTSDSSPSASNTTTPTPSATPDAGIATKDAGAAKPGQGRPQPGAPPATPQHSGATQPAPVAPGPTPPHTFNPAAP